MNTTPSHVLADLIGEALALFDSLGGMSSTARPGAEEVLPHVAAWTQHIYYSIGGIQALFESGREHCVPPVLRLIIEHATAMAIVGNDPERYAEYMHDTYRGAINVQQARAEAGVLPDTELEEFLTSGPAERPNRVNRKDHFLSLGEMGRLLYVSWLDQTQQSHASHATATLFLRPNSIDEVPVLSTSPQWTIDPVHVYGACLDCLTLALDVFSSLLLDDPLRWGIDEINTRKDVLFATLGARDGLALRRFIDVPSGLPQPACSVPSVMIVDAETGG